MVLIKLENFSASNTTWMWWKSERQNTTNESRIIWWTEENMEHEFWNALKMVLMFIEWLVDNKVRLISILLLCPSLFELYKFSMLMILRFFNSHDTHTSYLRKHVFHFFLLDKNFCFFFCFCTFEKDYSVMEYSWFSERGTE